MIAGKQDACAHNNALWCDAVLKAAGAKTEFLGGFWIAREKTLPLYPNIVTYSEKPGADLNAALATLPKNSAVKDSYDRLDLAHLGFKKLFAGTWLFRPPQSSRKPPLQSDWHKAKHPEALKKWLNGWNSQMTACMPSSLAQSFWISNTIDFATVSKGETIRAGAVFNRGSEARTARKLSAFPTCSAAGAGGTAAMHDLLEPFRQQTGLHIRDRRRASAGLPSARICGVRKALAVWLKDLTAKALLDLCPANPRTVPLKNAEGEP